MTFSQRDAIRERTALVALESRQHDAEMQNRCCALSRGTIDVLFS
jgi:hypothetical protein